METRIDHLTGGIYRISTMTEAFGITFNQFLIDDERPMLIHTGEHAMFEPIRRAVTQVLDPAALATSRCCTGRATRPVVWIAGSSRPRARRSSRPTCRPP